MRGEMWVRVEICGYGMQNVDVVCNILVLYNIWMRCVIFGCVMKYVGMVCNMGVWCAIDG